MAVVGGAGFVGRALARALAARGVRVVVVDRAEGTDITAPGARDALAARFARERAAAVVHLAARVDPATPREREAARRLHVDGTAAVVEAARAAGVRRFVLASSAVVYGARAHNRVPLDETSPVRPNPDFAYAVDKAAQEDVVARLGAGLSVAVARPAIIYGPGAKSYLTEIIKRAPVLPALDGRRPQLQFVHVDDVAAALAFLALDGAEGAFNVASADWLALEDVAALAHKPIVAVPSTLAAPILEALSRVLPPHLRAPRSMLPYLMHPFVVSSRKVAAAGCAPRFSSADALRALWAPAA